MRTVHIVQCTTVQYFVLKSYFSNICNLVPFLKVPSNCTSVFTHRLPWRPTAIILICGASSPASRGARATECSHRRQFAQFTHVEAVDHWGRQTASKKRSDVFKKYCVHVAWANKDMKPIMAGSSRWSQLQEQMVVQAGQLSVGKFKRDKTPECKHAIFVYGLWPCL